MLVNLVGETIDLSKIYSISDIIKPNTRRFDDSEYSFDDEVEWMNRFHVDFIDDNSITINEEQANGLNDLKRIREELIAHWSNNQSEIIIIK